MKLLSQHYLEFHDNPFIMAGPALTRQDANQLGQTRPKKRKEEFLTIKNEDDVEMADGTAKEAIGSGSASKIKGMTDLPLGENGQKLRAQLLFESMMQNVEVHEEEEKSKSDHSIFACITCGKMFESEKGLKSHLYSAGPHHNNQCPRCPGVKFESWPEHQEHQAKFHNGVFFVRCRHCPEARLFFVHFFVKSITLEQRQD